MSSMWLPRYGKDAILARVREKQLSRECFPYLSRAITIVSTRDDMLSIGRPCYATHETRVTAICAESIAGMRIPDLDSAERVT